MKGIFNLISNDNNQPLNDEIMNSGDQAEEIKDTEESPEADPENTAGAEEESSDYAEQQTESADEVTDEVDDIYEGGKYTTDEDDIAFVAERITGARHSVSATAAPIVIREKGEPYAKVQSDSVTGTSAATNKVPTESAEKVTSNAANGQKKLFRSVISAAVALIVLLSTAVVGINVVLNSERAADYDMAQFPDGQPEVIEPENEPDLLEASDTETDSGTSEQSDAPESNAETSDTESQTETETEPVKQLYTVKLDFYARTDIDVSTEQITFGELLEGIGCTLTEGEVPSVGLDYVIAADTIITIDNITYGTETITEPIAYESEVIEVDTVPRGTTNYVQYGENGTIEKTYTIEYKNGVEQSRTLTSENTTKWPVNEKYELGVGGSFVGSDGVTYTYSYRKVVPATYYNIEGLTYLGTMADESVIAVDRSYIPLGTKLYVKNDKYDFGVRIASDVGSMIKEWEIDIWIDESNPQYASFSKDGYHYDMEIYYID